MNVTINESSVSVPAEVATWGELLDWLETGYFKRGQCITKVAVDGEEDIDYRSASACDQELTTVGQIHIESSDFDLVLRFQRIHRRFDGAESQAEAPRQLRAGQLAREVHVLQYELKNQVEREAGILQQ